MDNQIWLWIWFNLFVLLMLALDLGVFHRKSHEIKFKEAITWSAVWISLALIFNAGIYHFMGAQKGTEFLTGYLIEKALSVDNIFVFVLIFSFFKVPESYKHRVLFYGVLGALVMRVIFIFSGVALIEKFHWIIYVFGAFLIVTGIKMALADKDKKPDLEKNPVVKLFRRLIPVTENYEGNKFLVKRNAKWVATPLLIVLILIETTDLIFAVDSIPAILAITNDTFIVYTSNVFAILGLRSLYFALAGIIHLFRFLHYGLAAILVFVGAKMVIVDFYKVPVSYSLVIILLILVTSIVSSLVIKSPSEKSTILK